MTVNVSIPKVEILKYFESHEEMKQTRLHFCFGTPLQLELQKSSPDKFCVAFIWCTKDTYRFCFIFGQKIVTSFILLNKFQVSCISKMRSSCAN